MSEALSTAFFYFASLSVRLVEPLLSWSSTTLWSQLPVMNSDLSSQNTRANESQER